MSPQPRRDRVATLIYLIVVPLMIVVILSIVLWQTRTTRNETKKLAQETCQHLNARNRALKEIVKFAGDLTESLNDLTPAQERQLTKIRRSARTIEPFDCTP